MLQRGGPRQNLQVLNCSGVHAIQLLILLLVGGMLCLIFNYALCKYPQRLMQ